jgi:hypothetical protein
MNDKYINKHDYGLILLRDNYEDALAESENLYDKECERKNTSTPKAERTTRHLLGVKENVLSGQVGLYLPPRNCFIEVPNDAVTATHIDNPLWVEYEYINGEAKMVIGSLPFGQFGVGLVNPANIRAKYESYFSPELLRQIRGSSRKYTLEVHSRCNSLIQEILAAPEAKQALLNTVSDSVFEELVADLLRDKGCDVFLTSRTRDGGKDIWIATFFNGKPIVALVECKVRKNSVAIDPAIARAVVGTFCIEKNRGIDVDCALLVTSSDKIGPQTIAIEQELREFKLRDCDAVLEWIKSYGSIREGLWLPSALESILF